MDVPCFSLFIFFIVNKKFEFFSCRFKAIKSYLSSVNASRASHVRWNKFHCIKFHPHVAKMKSVCAMFVREKTWNFFYEDYRFVYRFAISVRNVICGWYRIFMKKKSSKPRLFILATFSYQRLFDKDSESSLLSTNKLLFSSESIHS